GNHVVLMRSQLVYEPWGYVRRVERIVGQKIVRDRVELALRDYVARQWAAGPCAVGVLPNSGWIVERIPHLLTGCIEEVEIAVEHVRAGHVPSKCLRSLLMVPGIPEQPERLVLSVVNLGDANRSAQHA